MKAVLISIQPKWCNLIAKGKKTVEVRKTKPKLETPFKCYIYESLGARTIEEPQGRQKVIGEFVCDFFDEFEKGKGVKFKRFMALKETCLDVNSILRYMGTNDMLYGWHISRLKIYDTTKDLEDFTKFAYLNINGYCGNKDCKNYISNGYYEPPQCAIEGCFLIDPPQSWCYVEELK